MILQADLSPETLLHGAEFILMVAGGFMALKIHSAVSEVLLKQAEVKEELTARIAKTATDVAVHQAEDDVKFEVIGRTLERIDAKLEKIA
jgi:hypothetical protein